jgi:ABC-type polysaccharide/polyol phosphate transport system ATPase subunit
LLDEWMDTETSTVVQKVQPSLQRLVERGAVVISVTHKPNLYHLVDGGMRRITLCRGSILSCQ